MLVCHEVTMLTMLLPARIFLSCHALRCKLKQLTHPGTFSDVYTKQVKARTYLSALCRLSNFFSTSLSRTRNPPPSNSSVWTATSRVSSCFLLFSSIASTSAITKSVCVLLDSTSTLPSLLDEYFNMRLGCLSIFTKGFLQLHTSCASSSEGRGGRRPGSCLLMLLLMTSSLIQNLY